MTLFNYSKWIAKEVTGPKNIDKKIFIVGPAGSGKSMTGMSMAKAVAKWISVCNHGDPSHADDYFKFDKDHVAVINTDDLVHVMTTNLPRNSVKVIDDCGAAEGFTNRRAMSKANLDIVSIYGTNRVRNGVLIICVQDTMFTDLRMRKLANEIIDLNDYVQSGPCRMGKLYKIRMDDKNRGGIRKCRFMTYEHGEWVTHESIACFPPPEDLRTQYDALRIQKEQENTKMINERYSQINKDDEKEKEQPRCPYCNSKRLYYSEKSKQTSCKNCGRKS